MSPLIIIAFVLFASALTVLMAKKRKGTGDLFSMNVVIITLTAVTPALITGMSWKAGTPLVLYRNKATYQVIEKMTVEKVVYAVLQEVSVNPVTLQIERNDSTGPQFFALWNTDGVTNLVQGQHVIAISNDGRFTLYPFPRTNALAEAK
jgi:Na+/proline symporter